jgi:hypothetical protein
MIDGYQMPGQIEQVVNNRMSIQKPLSLPCGFESLECRITHTSLPNPGCLMRLLGSIILILLSTMNHIRYQLPVGHTIASQFICNDLLGLSTMASYQTFEGPLSRSSI